MTFSDHHIAVLNQGPTNPTLWYNGRAKQFPVGRATIISEIEAYFHFGVEVIGGKLVRNKADRDEKGNQTQYASRVASLSPYGLLYGREKEQNPEAFQALRNWFADGLRFKIVKSSKEIAEEEFERIK